MPLYRYVLRRVLFVIPLLIGITIVAFIIANAVPADPINANLPQNQLNDPVIVAAFRAKWGLDKPPLEQYLTYLGNLLHGDLGTSIKTHQPVAQDIAQFLPATIELATVGVVIGVVIGVIFGVVSAVWRNHLIDYFVRMVGLIGVSIPVFVLALFGLAFFHGQLGFAAGPGRLGARIAAPATITGLFTVDSLLAGQLDIFRDAVAHLELPSLVLGLYIAGLISRVTRSSMLEVLSADYMRTARAKGLQERLVVLRHGLSNALLPIVTVIGLSYGNLLSGAVLTESIFAWPGIGRYMFRASTSQDFPAIMGVSILIAFIYVVVNLIVDILYYFIDPRIRARRNKYLYLARKNPLMVAGIVLVAVWILLAVFAPQFAPYTPLTQKISERLQAPGALHLWGTDELGRDIYSRVLYGGRITIPAGIIVIIIGSLIGTLIGALAGFLGGIWDEVIMRLTELFMAFPTIILAMAITAALGPDIRNAIIALVVVWWPSYARLVRGLVLKAKTNEYVEAAQCLGASKPYLLLRTILPNCLAPTVVLTTLDIGNAILTFAGLSFLGLGPEPTSPEWGRMVAVGINYFDQWWTWLFPGLAIALLVIAFNFIGDGLRDIFDPRLR